MKFRIALLSLLLSALFSQGQNESFSADQNQDAINKSIAEFTDAVSKHHYSSQQKLVKAIFRKAHVRFLRTYSAYAQPIDVINNGTFDCLSGTYFLSKTFDQLGIKYKLFETNYHIFIIAETDEGELLLESTDRFHGIISGRENVEEKISDYKKYNSSSKNFYLSNVQLFNELPAYKLMGLLYFNKAVALFKKNEYVESCYFLEQAWKVYDNVRIESFVPILMKAIQTSNINVGAKESISLKLNSYQSSSYRTLAFR